MACIRIDGRKALRTIGMLDGIDLDRICIWEPITEEKAEEVGFRKKGDRIVPSANLGRVCYKNVNGYTYPDKKRPKERRVVSSRYIYPFGNENANEVLVDITRECYPQINVNPFEIEIEYLEDTDGIYVSVVCDEKVKMYYIKEAVNIMLELFGGCYISDDGRRVSHTKRTRVNWKLLPKGERPSEHIKKCISTDDIHLNRFIYSRLNYIERYEVDEIVVGINSFQGYYGYLMKEYCILESAVYGNATYIIKRENWEEQTKKSKGELLKKLKVVAKIEHTKNWERNMYSQLNRLGVQLPD